MDGQAYDDGGQLPTLLADLLSPHAPFGRQVLPGARAPAMHAFILCPTHRQVYAWPDGMAGDLTTDAPFAAFILYNGTALVVAP